MKRPRKETMEQRANTLAKELDELNKKLAEMHDEEAEARAAREREDDLIAGAILVREMKAAWKADPTKELAMKEEFSRRLVNRRERQAFGLSPLPRAQATPKNASANSSQ